MESEEENVLIICTVEYTKFPKTFSHLGYTQYYGETATQHFGLLIPVKEISQEDFRIFQTAPPGINYFNGVQKAVKRIKDNPRCRQISLEGGISVKKHHCAYIFNFFINDK